VPTVQDFATIHLNGHVHTNDTIAIAEIARQLDTQTSGVSAEVGNFSDSLDAVLSMLASSKDQGGLGKPVNNP